MRVRVFGTGCASCTAMLRDTQAALTELGLDSPVEHVSRIQDMMAAGITGTPALEIDGTLCSEGRALDVAAIKRLLVAHQGR